MISYRGILDKRLIKEIVLQTNPSDMSSLYQVVPDEKLLDEVVQDVALEKIAEYMDQKHVAMMIHFGNITDLEVYDIKECVKTTSENKRVVLVIIAKMSTSAETLREIKEQCQAENRRLEDIIVVPYDLPDAYGSHEGMMQFIKAFKDNGTARLYRNEGVRSKLAETVTRMAQTAESIIFHTDRIDSTSGGRHIWNKLRYPSHQMPDFIHKLLQVLSNFLSQKTNYLTLFNGYIFNVRPPVFVIIEDKVKEEIGDIRMTENLYAVVSSTENTWFARCSYMMDFVKTLHTIFPSTFSYCRQDLQDLRYYDMIHQATERTSDSDRIS